MIDLLPPYQQEIPTNMTKTVNTLNFSVFGQQQSINNGGVRSDQCVKL